MTRKTKTPTPEQAIAKVFLGLQDALPQLATIVRSDVLAEIAHGCQQYHTALRSARAGRGRR